MRGCGRAGPNAAAFQRFGSTWPRLFRGFSGSLCYAFGRLWEGKQRHTSASATIFTKGASENVLLSKETIHWREVRASAEQPPATYATAFLAHATMAARSARVGAERTPTTLMCMFRMHLAPLPSPRRAGSREVTRTGLRMPKSVLRPLVPRLASATWEVGAARGS